MSCLSCLLKNMLEDSVAADVLSRQVNDGTGALERAGHNLGKGISLLFGSGIETNI